MTVAPKTIDDVRESASKWLTVTAFAFSATTMGAGLLLPISSVLPGLVAFLFATMALLGWRQRNAFGRQLIGIAITGQAMAFVSVWGGTGWQVDAHFAFLAFLAILVSLFDIRTILVATVAIVLHHLVFGMLFAQFVFPSTDIWGNVLRAVFHAILVVILVVGLIASILTRHRLERQAMEAISNAQAQSEAAEQARTESERALKEADAKRQEAEQAQAESAKLLQSLQDAERARETAEKERRAEEAERKRITEAQLKAQEAVVQTLSEGLSRLSKGDIAHKIEDQFPDGYEALREYFNETVQSFGDIIHDFQERVDQLRSQVAAISTSSESLAVRTEKQVDAVASAVSDMTGMNQTMQDSVAQASSTARRARDLQTKAEAGGEIVRKAVAAMDEIEKSSAEIAEINALIDGIAFQTNLLALNAGVEAARAGEAGRGFSVVASEVRALSQRATEAANEITRLVSKSQEHVRSGVSLVSDAGESLEEMVAEIAEVTGSVDQLSAVSDKQKTGMNGVVENISQLDAVAQSNAAMFEETSAACVALNKGMDEMSLSLAHFNAGRAQASAEAA